MFINNFSDKPCLTIWKTFLTVHVFNDHKDGYTENHHQRMELET